MKFHVLTLFPEFIAQATDSSILGRAKKKGLIEIDTVNIRDYATNVHGRVDDYPYGGGAGMVMEAEPVYRAVTETRQRAEGSVRVVYLTPQARVLTQTRVESLAREDELILLCGHYEGIDDRVLQEVVTDYISIGDYVLTGGELGALVLIDAVSRFVPGVLSNAESSQFESMQDNLLEYPHYTRPEVWRERRVPEVLLGGDHQKIEAWRYEESLSRTRERRPDLLRQSLKVLGISLGGAPAGELAKNLVRRISRYGICEDYDRRKLQKSQRLLDEKTLVLILCGPACRDEEPSVFFRNIRAGQARLAVFYSGEITEEQRRSYDSYLKERGFLILMGREMDDLTSDEAFEEAGLDIRIAADASVDPGK